MCNLDESPDSFVLWELIGLVIGGIGYGLLKLKDNISWPVAVFLLITLGQIILAARSVL